MRSTKKLGGGRPRFPDGYVGFAIGDIHGRLDLLKRMLERLDLEAGGVKQRKVIFLGDYIDRGPDASGVIDLLLDPSTALEGFERHFLLGNHEAAMLAFLRAPAQNHNWLSHGGLDTLASYGVSPLPSIGARGAQVAAAAVKFFERLPPAHLQFFMGLKRYVQFGDYVFVHAGVAPGRALPEQTDSDLLWIRRRFLSGRQQFAEGTVVHGHTPTARPFKDNRRIGIDTGAYFSGCLTAVRLEGDEARFVTVTDK